MEDKITKESALKLLKKYINKESILLHSKESALVMQGCAKYLSQDEELWYVTGLLHDLDMQMIDESYKGHGDVTVKILMDEGYKIDEMNNAILAHTECLNTGYKRESVFDFALCASEQITGIITAYARMRPLRFDGLNANSIKKKLKDKTFAANVSREFIYDIVKAGIELDVFLDIAIKEIASMQDEIDF